MPPGWITLADIAARTDVLAVACSRCDRAGQYKLASLIERYGADSSVPMLLQALSADCAKRRSTSPYDLCGVHCPALSTLFRKLD